VRNIVRIRDESSKAEGIYEKSKDSRVNKEKEEPVEYVTADEGSKEEIRTHP